MRKIKKKKLFCFILVLIFLVSILIPVLSAVDSEIRINVPSRTLQLYKSGRLIREYSVGVGSSKSLMTPPGVYTVDKRVINPIWEHPYKAPGQSRLAGASNPLGTRWIGFHSEGSGVYGIHGTNEPNSIGRFVSHGCVRMHNSEVEEIFELVDVGTPVIVSYDRFKLSQHGSTINLEVFPDPYAYKSLTASEIAESIQRISPYVRIDYELLSQAIKDTSDSSIYEVAKIETVPIQYPFSDPYSGGYGRYAPLPPMMPPVIQMPPQQYNPYPSYQYQIYSSQQLVPQARYYY